MILIWSLFFPQPFSLFASSYHRRHFLEGQTVQTVQKLGERRQCSQAILYTEAN